MRISAFIIFISVVFIGCSKSTGGIEDASANDPNPANPNEIIVPEKNSTLVNFFTNAGCSPCGDWGWKSFEKIISHNKNDAIYMGVYKTSQWMSNQFSTREADDFVRRLKINGWPTFSVNGVIPYYRDINNFNVDSERDSVNDAIQRSKQNDVKANTGFNLMYDGDTLRILTKTKFFKKTSGYFYLGVYLVEHEVIGKQAGYPEIVYPKHNYVLRGGARLEGVNALIINESFGYSLFKGYAVNIESGDFVEKSYRINIKDYDRSKLSVVTILWEKVGADFYYVNSSSNQ